MSAVTFTTGIALAPRVAKAARARRNVAVAAKATPEAPAVVTKDVKRGLTLAAGVTSASALAAGSAMANDVLFQVAEFDGTGVIDEETALYALVGGSLAICTAVLSLVIGSDLFIKNIVNK